MRNWKKTIGAVLFSLCLTSEASANILWMGGEDVDFPNGAAACVETSGGFFRSGYARGTVHPCTAGQIPVSTVFPGGAITSGWVSFRFNLWASNYAGKLVGFITQGTMNSLWVGEDSSDSSKVALFTYNGTTWTEIASSATGTLPSSLFKIDMQLISYGASATVNVYVNGSSTVALTYSGNVAVGGNTSVNAIAVGGDSVAFHGPSEIIVSDSDTRLLSLVTLAPNAAGTTNQWTGSYTNVNPTSINDASYITDNTSGDTFETKLISLPSSSVLIQGVKVIARATKTGGGLGSLSVGVYTNSTVNAPSAFSLTSGWASYETYYSTNPVTSTNWSASDINSLQINLQSAP